MVEDWTKLPPEVFWCQYLYSLSWFSIADFPPLGQILEHVNQPLWREPGWAAQQFDDSTSPDNARPQTSLTKLHIHAHTHTKHGIFTCLWDINERSTLQCTVECNIEKLQPIRTTAKSISSKGTQNKRFLTYVGFNCHNNRWRICPVTQIIKIKIKQTALYF